MLKLMIVDDSNIIRRRIERCNTDRKQYKVVALAENGVEAVRAFKETRPDIVTMDLTMPQMNGVDCIEALVAINPNVLILVISALSDKSTGIEALEKGARGFVCKPFTDEVLMSALDEITG